MSESALLSHLFPTKHPRISKRRAEGRLARLEQLEDRTLLNAAGSLDPTFGAGGLAVANFPNDGGADQANAVALQPDGKIVAVGHAILNGPTEGEYPTVVRYNQDGTPDPTFGSGGQLVLLQLPGISAVGVHLLNNGDIIVAGYAGDISEPHFGNAYVVFRLTPAGTLDPSFGSAGIASISLSGGPLLLQANGLAIDANGNILVCGGVELTPPEGGEQWDCAMVRFTPNGALDLDFGVAGLVTTNFDQLFGNGSETDSVANSIALQGDGKIVLAGDCGIFFAVARYTSSGTLDPTFGTGGEVITPFYYPTVSQVSLANSVVIQPDGSILVGGTAEIIETLPGHFYFALARYTPSGQLDPTFGTGGTALTLFDTVGANYCNLQSLALAPDGDIVAGGFASDHNGNSGFALARYTPNGAPDPSFGDSGQEISPFGYTSEVFGFLPPVPIYVFDPVQAIVLQPDGRIVLAGAILSPDHGDGQFAVARYLSNASVLVPFDLSPNVVPGAVDFSYQVQAGPTATATTVALYWSTSNNFADAIGGPVYSQGVPGGTPIDNYGPVTVSEIELGAPPPGASYLLAVADPGDLLGGFTQNRNVTALPVIHVDSLSTPDSRSLTLDYHVNFANITGPLTANFYRSLTDRLDPQTSSLLKSVGLSNVSIGPHEVTVSLPEDLPPDTKLPYVLAICGLGSSIATATTVDNTAFFRTYVIGAVVEGFDPLSPVESTPPAWVQVMAGDLETLNGYVQPVIPFLWDSFLPGSTAAEAAESLYSQIGIKARILASSEGVQSNDVIDLQLIGHSRGAVVASLAMALLVKDGSVPAQLAHGYYKLTLLDPHPANNEYGFNGSASSTTYVAADLDLEFHYVDPAIVVPSRVNEVDDLFQQSSIADVAGSQYFIERNGLNLHGLGSGDLHIQGSPAQTRLLVYDMTGTGIGHSEVHDWYQTNVVEEGKLGSDVIPPQLRPPTGGGSSVIVDGTTLTAPELQAILATRSSISIPIANGIELAGVMSAIRDLDSPVLPTYIAVNLEGGGFGDVSPSLPDGVTFILTGDGSPTVTGHSPALNVNGRTVVAVGIIFATDTNSPTLLVTGGSVFLRDDTIEETDSESQAAVAISSGAADLGDTEGPGNDVLNVNGPGEFIDNSGVGIVSTLGDTFEQSGIALTASTLCSTALTSNVETAIFGEPVKLIAAVQPASTSSALPAGTVDFRDVTNGIDLGSATLVEGAATLTTSALAVGSDTIQATYSGDATFLTSNATFIDSVQLAGSVTLAAAGAGSQQPFAVTKAHNLVQVTGPLQTNTLATGVQAISAVTEAATGQQIVFALLQNKALLRLDVSTGSAAWIGGAGTILQASAGLDAQGRSDVFVITADGSWTQWSSSAGWLPKVILGPGSVFAIKAVDVNRAYALSQAHAIIGYDPHWGVFRVTSDGFAATFDTVVDSQQTEVVWAVTPNKALYRYSPSTGWTQFGGDGSIQAVSAGLDGGRADVVAITTAGDLFRLNDIGWQRLGAAGTILTMQATDDDRFFVVGGDQTILEFDDLHGWFSLTGSGFAQP